jgi:hypothetical protein
MKLTSVKKPCLAVAGLLLLLSSSSAMAAAEEAPAATISVSGTRWGTSMCYIGATEGDARFDIQDLRDAGINTYRIYGGMSRWEPQDDDGVFGAPSIADIKQDPQVINWSWWDQAMTMPPGGSDYRWTHADHVWQGSAREMFRDLKAAGIRTVLTLRNVDDRGNPEWARTHLNPPNTEAARDEWWAHVFATVYWLNVRHDYGVDDFEIHNEPDNEGQGWRGTRAEYEAFAKLTADAIRYVYRTYLPGRTPSIYAPATVAGSNWPESMVRNVPDAFDSVAIHNYKWYAQGYVSQVRSWMNANRFAGAPLWLSEWGADEPWYTAPHTGVDLIGSNLIRLSSPGSYVDGSHLFSFYDWGGTPNVPSTHFQGLINRAGERRTSFYGLRIATRALQGCRPTYQSTTSDAHLTAITTRDGSGAVYLLVTNASETTSYSATVDLSALKTTGEGQEWRYDATHHDVLVGTPVLTDGHVTVWLPATSTVLLRF